MYPRVTATQTSAGAAFMDWELEFTSLGLELVDAIAPERETLARHKANMGRLSFPFGVRIAYDSEGLPFLQPLEARLEPALKSFARISSLCKMGSAVAEKVARRGGFTPELIQGVLR